MKYSFLLMGLVIFSCGKKTTAETSAVETGSAVLNYDTMAIDSFSTGATSVDVARQIKISSQRYQDSLAQIQQKTEIQKLEKEKAEKAEAEKKQAQKKGKEEAEGLQNTKTLQNEVKDQAREEKKP